MEVTIKTNDSTDVDIVLKDIVIVNEEARELNYAGVQLAKKGKYRKAEKKFIAAFRIEPENPIILNNMGNIYREIGTNKMALEYYSESFIASDSTYFNAGYNMGIAYCNLGEYDKSLKILQKVIEDTDDPNRIMISEYAKVRVYLSQNDCDRAKQLYIKIKTDLDEFPQFRKNREKLENRIKNCVNNI
ncbi:tetratricopeptide repeat protein [Altibacter sp.]|uniref:tetratricopeptide repeat protein n=1 Tax=Altibacter sp. TaxID=2024823 RepID=UPI0025BEF41B|nr:tetratricopeptide repeat protein [Altibacter sp.]